MSLCPPPPPPQRPPAETHNGLQSYCVLAALRTRTIWIKLPVNKAKLFDLIKIDSAMTVAVSFASANEFVSYSAKKKNKEPLQND